jgi:hypothetical protein
MQGDQVYPIGLDPPGEERGNMLRECTGEGQLKLSHDNSLLMLTPEYNLPMRFNAIIDMFMMLPFVDLFVKNPFT